MKNSRMKISGAAVISAIAIGVIGFTGGCKSQEVLKDRPFIPAPSSQEPSNPPSAAPAVVTPIVAKPALPPPPPPPAAANLAPVQTIPK